MTACCLPERTVFGQPQPPPPHLETVERRGTALESSGGTESRRLRFGLAGSEDRRGRFPTTPRPPGSQVHQPHCGPRCRPSENAGVGFGLFSPKWASWSTGGVHRAGVLRVLVWPGLLSILKFCCARHDEGLEKSYSEGSVLLCWMRPSPNFYEHRTLFSLGDHEYSSAKNSHKQVYVGNSARREALWSPSRTPILGPRQCRSACIRCQSTLFEK